MKNLLFQDLPDIEGDRKFQIETFASKYGIKNIANVASLVLASAYVAAIVLPVVLPGQFRTVPMVIGHSLYLLYFVYSYNKFDPDSMSSLKSFYKAIWNLFYLEYCLYPFI